MSSDTTLEQSTWTIRQIWMLTVACCAVALVVAAMAALNTALPDLARDTGATQSQLTWIVDGYTLTLACLLLPAGALGDRYGRRELLMFGLLVFAAGSSIPVFADEPSWIIVSRVISGVGAAFVMPATLSLLTAGFPPAQRARAVGVWSGVAGSGAIAGLVVSGLLLEKWSWHSIFVSLAVVSVLILVVSFTIVTSKDTEATPLDLPGTALIAGSIGLFVLGMIEAPARGWLDPVVLALLIGGIAMTAVFSWVELRTRHPLLDVRLFANRAFGSGAASLTLQFLATFGLFFLIVQYLQLVLDYSPAIGTRPHADRCAGDGAVRGCSPTDSAYRPSRPHRNRGCLPRNRNCALDALGRQFDLCRSLCSLGSGRYWIGFVDNPRHCCHRLQRTGLQTGCCISSQRRNP